MHYLKFNNRPYLITSKDIKNETLINALTRANFCYTAGGDHYITDLFSRAYKVPDVWRYTFFVSNNHIKLRIHRSIDTSSRFRDKTPRARAKYKKIVLVLESPHKDEYIISGSDLKPLFPAYGDTGMTIQSKLTEFLSKLELADGIYALYIVNPVPYMTSFGAFLETKLITSLRNSVWSLLWDIKAVQRYFINRMKVYRPNIIVNCCTARLNDKVEGVLKIWINNQCCESRPMLYKGYHPCINWNKGLFLRHKVENKCG